MRPEIIIGNTTIGLDHPTYFIADIASNHGGSLEIAKQLIFEAAEAGANAAKFQHFKAETLISDVGFEKLGEKIAHQKDWEESALSVYKKVEVPKSWTRELYLTAKEAGIDFFTAPYDLGLIDEVEDFVSAYKVGSGDITWIESITKMAKKNVPLLLATGASSFEDVKRAVNSAFMHKSSLVLMQCNTNYTGIKTNISYTNLNVLSQYSKEFPEAILGLSDHTPGHVTVLGAVALGARVIEKHFASQMSPHNSDLHFSLLPNEWQEMVKDTRQLEAALGDGFKKIEDNEKESIIAQRRSVRYSKPLKVGHVVDYSDLVNLRPCPPNAFSPYESRNILGKVLKRDVDFQEVASMDQFERENHDESDE